MNKNPSLNFLLFLVAVLLSIHLIVAASMNKKLEKINNSLQGMDLTLIELDESVNDLIGLSEKSE